MMMTDDTVLIPVMMDAGPVSAGQRKTRIAWENIGRLLAGGRRSVRRHWDAGQQLTDWTGDI